MATFLSLPTQIHQIPLLELSWYWLAYTGFLSLYYSLKFLLRFTCANKQVTTKFLFRSPSAAEHDSCLVINYPKTHYLDFLFSLQSASLPPQFLRSVRLATSETNRKPNFSLLLQFLISDPTTELVMTNQLWNSSKTEWKPKLYMRLLAFFLSLSPLFLAASVACAKSFSSPLFHCRWGTNTSRSCYSCPQWCSEPSYSCQENCSMKV